MRIEQLSAEVHHLLSVPGEEAATHASTMQLLEEYFRHPRECHAIWHPLGFVHIIAIPGEDALRVHLWPKLSERSQASAASVHDHIWSLTSQVILGGLVNIHLRAVPASLEYATHEEASVEYDDDLDILVGSGRTVVLEEVSRELVRERNRYTVPVGALHCTVMEEEGPVVTAVRAIKSVNQAPITFVPLRSKVEPARRIRCTPNELSRIIRGFLDHIESE